VDYLRLPAAPQGEKYRHLVRRELSEAASARTVLAVTREGRRRCPRSASDSAFVTGTELIVDGGVSHI
jgi:hypothetical protein